jgi:hypothetical protein
VPEEKRGKDEAPDRRQRLERLEADGGSAHLPPLPAAGHLVSMLFEMGPTLPAGMGEAPITFSEIDAWQHVTGIRVNAWEGRMLRRLSGAYAAERAKGVDIKRPAPWPEGIEGAKRMAANSLRRAMRETAALKGK